MSNPLGFSALAKQADEAPSLAELMRLMVKALARMESRDKQTLAFSIDDLAAGLRVSSRHVQAMDTAGLLPRPIRLGRLVRWPADEFRAWLACGCPPRDVWERREVQG